MKLTAQRLNDEQSRVLPPQFRPGVRQAPKPETEPSRRFTDEERRQIEAAIAAGRITRVPAPEPLTAPEPVHVAGYGRIEPR